MSSMVFATPKGGLHRADTMDGSIATMSSRGPLDGEYKDQVIDAFARSITKGKGIDAQAKKLQEFLKKNGINVDITKQVYIKYLKSEKIEDL